MAVTQDLHPSERASIIYVTRKSSQKGNLGIHPAQGTSPSERKPSESADDLTFGIDSDSLGGNGSALPTLRSI